MQAYVLQENIRRFRAKLETLDDPQVRDRVALMLQTAQRELALLEAARSGAIGGAQRPRPGREAARAEAQARFQKVFAASPLYAGLIDPGPGLPFVDVNAAYVAASVHDRETLIGRNLFDLYPDNPENPGTDGIVQLYEGLRAAAASACDVSVPVYRFDIEREGRFEARYWKVEVRPWTDDAGELQFLVMIVGEAEKPAS